MSLQEATVADAPACCKKRGPHERGRGSTIAPRGENGVTLLLNGYLLAFRTNLLDQDATAD